MQGAVNEQYQPSGRFFYSQRRDEKQSSRRTRSAGGAAPLYGLWVSAEALVSLFDLFHLLLVHPPTLDSDGGEGDVDPAQIIKTQRNVGCA